MDDRRRRNLDPQQSRALEDALELIPRGVRDKLDQAGIKLHLAEWLAFSFDERAGLRDLPCSTQSEIEDYRRAVEGLVRIRCDKDADRMRR